MFAYALIGLIFFSAASLILFKYFNHLSLFINPPKMASIPYFTLVSMLLIISSFGGLYFIPISWTIFLSELLSSNFGSEPINVFSNDLNVLVKSMLIMEQVLIAPLFEELLFRGYLLHFFYKYFGLRFSTVIVAIIFALPHPDVLGSALFSIILSVITLKSRSLYPAIIIHILFNIFGLLIIGFDLDVILVRSMEIMSIDYTEDSFIRYLIGNLLVFVPLISIYYIARSRYLT
ncbi:type II CAAX endopeptidase family protein [Reinekea marina]|nr:type II CAAX endopeptidase family protein [Reinekea marina]MDN3647903.1 type II CAAX endopeptidase family protein [Reinekea marina]